MSEGQTIAGRYVLDDLAGHGGMGMVYRARELDTGRTVAIKLLQPGTGDRVRFAREAEALARISHDGVVRYLDHGHTADNQPYLVMEWLDGCDLKHYLRRGPMAIADVITLARRLAEVLAVLHAAGIVHRDIKPANLFLEAERVDRLKVLDLGIARVRWASGDKTGTGAVLGTPAYMAPEQARGHGRIDARADVFAAGCVLYQCLAGVPPFVADEAMAVLAKVLLEAPPPLRECRPETPRAFASLVERMIAKAPAVRPADGAALVSAIDAAQSDAPVGDDPATVSDGELRVVSVVFVPPLESTAVTVVLPNSRRDEATRPLADELGGKLAVSATGAEVAMLANGAIVAAWAAAGSPKDLAHRAVACALDWRDALGGRGVAVATGRATLVGRLPVGDAIDRAAALVRDVHDARVVVDETTGSLLAGGFEVRRDGELRVVAGRRDSEPARELLGKAVPMVGRDRELALLASMFDECVGEVAPRAALVIAPAGTGKTRLIHEAVRAIKLRQPEVVVATARLDTVTAGSPLALIARLVRQLANLDAAAEPAERWAQLVAAIGRRVPDADRIAGFIGELVAADSGPRVDPALAAARRDPGLMADGIRDTLITWLRAELAAVPHVLVIEDLHWADAPSVRLVDAMLDRLHDSPLFVLATARPELASVFPSLWSDRGTQEIRLGTLQRSACARLVRSALPDAPAELVDVIVQRTGGHPFFVEEVIRAVAAGATAEVLTDSMLGMLQARLDALGDDAKRVLRAACVFGQVFREDGLRALLPDHVPVHALLEQLVAKEIVESTSQREASFAFRHPLVRDAAYATLPAADLARAHALAGRWLESVTDADALAVADHFERGGVADRAKAWFVRAAERALAVSDFSGCLTAVARARASCPDDTATMLDLLAAEATFWRDGPVAATPLAERAYSSLAAGSPAWFRAANLRVSCSGQRGDNADVDEVARRAAAVPIADMERAALAGLLARACGQLVWTGRDLAPHVAKLDEIAADPFAFDAGLAGLILRARGSMAMRRADAGSAIRLLDEAAGAFAQAHARRDEQMVRLLLYGWQSRIGDARGVARLAEISERLAPADHGYLATFARFEYGMALVAWKRPDEALAVIDLAMPRLLGSPRALCIARFTRAWALLQLGRAAEAAEEADRAIALDAVDPLRARPYAIKAAATLARGRTEEAVALARRALELRGSRWELFEGIVDVAAARVLRAGGDDAAARAALVAVIPRLVALAASLAAGSPSVWELPTPYAELRALADELGVAIPP